MLSIPHIAELAEALRGVTDVELGIVRQGPGLERVLADARRHWWRGAGLCSSRIAIRDIFARADVLDLCATATACAASALHRPESRSAHYQIAIFPIPKSSLGANHILRILPACSRGRSRTGADEGSWDAMRNVAVLTKAAGEKEYVE